MTENNNLLLDALHGRNSGSRPPVWLMRQAGRYMPAYRKIRERHSFLQMCRTPELIAEITQQPIKELQVDAAILFSDILLIADAFGLGLKFEENIGPIIERPIQQLNDISNLAAISPADICGKLSFVAEGIKLLRQQLKVPLIGFAGAPFTVASYMIEGGSSRELKKTKQWLVRNPQAMHELLERITTATIAYLNMQIDAGAQALQLFDTWAGVLSYNHFQEFSLSYASTIVAALQERNIPLILFCKGSSLFANAMATTGIQALSIDWHAPLASIRNRIGTNICLQGNLDPYLLYAPEDIIRKEVKALLTDMDNDPGYIFNLGHGLLPDMKVDAVKVLVDTVKEWQNSKQPCVYV